MSAAAGLAVEALGFASSAIVKAIKALYGIANQLNDWIDEHIEVLKRSTDPLIASTGRVLEAAKFGFGLGYVAATVLIAAGQFLLGNPLSAIATLASSAVVMNPVAMTCGALGAIYFGWNALTPKEREQILEHLAAGMTLGVELIRAVVEFAIRKSKELMDSPQLEAAKKFIKSQAAAFGRSLYDVTKQIGDFATDSAETIAQKAGQATAAIKEAATHLGDAVVERAASAGEAIKAGADKLRDMATQGGPKSTFVEDATSQAPQLPAPDGKPDAPPPAEDRSTGKS